MRNNSSEEAVRKREPEVISFASATKIVIAVNNVTGLRPLRDSETKFWIFLNYSYRIVMVISVGYGVYWIYVYHLLKNSLKADNVVYLSLRIVNYLCYVCILALGGYHSDVIPGLRRRIAVLEESLTKLGAVVNNRNILLWIIGTYSVTMLNVLTLHFVWGYFIWPVRYTFYELFFSYITNIGSQVLLDFLTYASWLKSSFKQTNDLLKKFLVEGRQIKTGDLSSETNEARTDRINVQKYLNKWKPVHSHRRTRIAPLNRIPSVKHELQAVKKVHLLQEIRCLHLHLCRIMKTMNRAFDAQIMVYAFVIVLNVVAILYYVYSVLRTVDEDPSGGSATSMAVLNILYTCIKVTVTCYVCEDTMKETWTINVAGLSPLRSHEAREASVAEESKHNTSMSPGRYMALARPVLMKKVVEIIHECSISDFDMELKDEILQFSLQLSLNQVCNIKSDFFRLNFSFMRQCISSITTYLVIIIQWAQSIQSEQLSGLNTTESFQTQLNRTKTY